MRFLIPFVAAVLLAAQATPAGAKNFKESGSASAPITLEVYTDYQCPHCREFYLDVLPSLTKEFIATGKVRLIHRDFRLPQFQYSKTATRYANAAGHRARSRAAARAEVASLSFMIILRRFPGVAAALRVDQNI